MSCKNAEVNIETQNILKHKSAFELFFKEQYSPLCRFAFPYLKDADEAEEVVQNCFVKLWKDREQLQIESSVKAYLYASVRNACLNQIKHSEVKETYKKHQEYQDEATYSLNGELEGSELQDKINIAIENMPEQRRKVFRMSRFEGLKYKEIAEQLNISPKTVENHMGMAMKFMREELKDYLHLSIIIFFIEGLGDKLF